MSDKVNYTKGIFYILLCIGIIAVGTVLKLTAEVVLPITVAIFLGLVFHPVINTLHTKFRIPTILGIIIIFLLLFVLIFFIGTLLVSSSKAILTLYPKYEERFLTIYVAVAGIFNLPYDSDLSLFNNLWNQLGVRNAIQSMAVSFSNNLITFARNLTVVALFVVFLLMEMGLFKAKAIAALDGKSPGRITLIMRDIIQQVTKYISVKFFISLLTGIFVFLGTWVVNLDFPIIWGFLAFILNFIPNFGSIISGVLTTFFALIQFWPKPGPVIWVGFLMLAVNMILGNFVEPKVQGRNLGLSPFIIIISLSVWGWLWGFLGMILAVPMMVILKIICENISFLQPLSIFMGSKPPTESKHILHKESE
ncbi:MAG: AI-2E family transporter [Treponema sp.]|nr:AI-2E family transporter [Treponema sp.]